MVKKARVLDPIPDVNDLVMTTLRRIEKLAERKGVKPQYITRAITGDNKMAGDLLNSLPDHIGSDTRSISLRTYGIVHKGLAEMEKEQDRIEKSEATEKSKAA